MSLPEAVLAIADDMKALLAEMSTGIAPGLEVKLAVWEAQLRIAVKASGGVNPPVPQQGNILDHRAQIEKIKAERQAQKDSLGAEELDIRMVRINGGPLNGDYVSISGKMPVGAFTNLGGLVYSLKEDGSLHYEPNHGKKSEP